MPTTPIDVFDLGEQGCITLVSARGPEEAAHLLGLSPDQMQTENLQQAQAVDDWRLLAHCPPGAPDWTLLIEPTAPSTGVFVGDATEALETLSHGGRRACVLSYTVETHQLTSAEDGQIRLEMAPESPWFALGPGDRFAPVLTELGFPLDTDHLDDPFDATWGSPVADMTDGQPGILAQSALTGVPLDAEAFAAPWIGGPATPPASKA